MASRAAAPGRAPAPAVACDNAASSFVQGAVAPPVEAAAGVAAAPHAGPGAPTQDQGEAWRDWDNWVGLADDPEVLICFSTAHWTCRRCNVVGNLAGPP
eukprot:7540557-Alexandrium_andersonii.AAC.1